MFELKLYVPVNISFSHVTMFTGYKAEDNVSCSRLQHSASVESQTSHPQSQVKHSTTDRASDFFQDWWAKVTHGVKNGGSFSEMIGPSISN